ncbi:hypothetical protein NL676_030847 [Syzygium grande]|nr:hypothetical protein NL676_030847 [Syzygium grande]
MRNLNMIFSSDPGFSVRLEIRFSSSVYPSGSIRFRFSKIRNQIDQHPYREGSLISVIDHVGLAWVPQRRSSFADSTWAGSHTTRQVPRAPRAGKAKMSRRSSCTIYVGNLPGDVRNREVEDLFYKYGPIVDIDLKIPPRPPGYAFVEFEDPRDAEDAIRGRDGCKFDGYRLRSESPDLALYISCLYFCRTLSYVELAHGGRGYSSSVDRYGSYSGSGSSRGGVGRHSDYRVLVTGLPSSASWQDLKDHMRRAGDVCFSEVFRDRDGITGIVDYTNYDDMKYAIKKLDDTLFRNAFSRAYIRVREYDSRRSYSRSPSRSPSYSDRSRSRSPRKKYSRRSPSVSPARSVSSRSHSGSYARSYSRSNSRSRTPLSPAPRGKRAGRSPRSSLSGSRSPSVRSRSRSVDSREYY